jgi:hypothetical protein
VIPVFLGEKGERWIPVLHLGLEHLFVPVGHLVEAPRPVDDVSELGRF